tara:strand:- start:423 stop:617 length:195 start_codon:yes stop_codon:yes gene_type:complete
MKANEKAKELVVRFNYKNKHYLSLDAKQCALICVDEMLGNYEEKYKYCESRQFLEEVKQEINKL